jgi:hypothetical protein
MIMTMTPAAIEQRRANSKAIADRKRAETECSRGHSNWRVRPKNGRRYCLTCQLDRQWYGRRGLPYV